MKKIIFLGMFIASFVGDMKLALAVSTHSAVLRQSLFAPASMPITFSLSNNLELFFSSSDQKISVESILFSNNLESNAVRTKLAKKWIRNAAVRIFDDSVRSFLELVLNGCDATITAHNMPHVTGKFGMGFFSALSFLWHHEPGWTCEGSGSTIHITTLFRDAPGQPVQTYSIALHRVFVDGDPNNDDIEVTITGIDPVTNTTDYGFVAVDDAWRCVVNRLCSLTGAAPIDSLLSPTLLDARLRTLPTGTIVSIVPQNPMNTFSDITLDAIDSYIHYLDVYPYVRIQHAVQYNKAPLIQNTVGGCSTSPAISVMLEPANLTVIDAGTGISPEIALQKLLVPSVSTKASIRIDEEVLQPSLVPAVKNKSSTQSHFLITANGVIVTKVALPELVRNGRGKVCNLVVMMPHSTKLTLARNEIDIASDGKSFEETHLKKIIDATLSCALLSEPSNDISLLSLLFRGLEAWEQQSAARHIQGRFTNYFKRRLAALLCTHQHLVPVPQACYELLTQCELLSPHYKALALDDELVHSNYHKLETILKKRVLACLPSIADSEIRSIVDYAACGKLIAGISVYFMPDSKISNISTYGLRTTIFVSERLLSLRSLSAIAHEIVARVPELVLSPAYGDKNSGIYAWADSVSNYLGRSIKNISIESYQRPLEQLNDAVYGMPLYIQEHIEHLKNSILGLYNRYFTIDGALLPKEYGSTVECVAHVHEADNRDIVSICNLIEAVASDVSILEHLVNYTVSDFALKTDKHLQRNDLMLHALYVPTIDGNSLLSLLAALHSQLKKASTDIAAQLIKTIVAKAHSVQELSFLAYLFLQDDIVAQLCSIKQSELKSHIQLLSQVIEYYIQEKIDRERINEFYEQCRKIKTLQERKALLTLDVAHSLIYDLFTSKMTSVFGTTQAVLQRELEGLEIPAQSYTVTQLLRAHCAENGLSSLLATGDCHRLNQHVNQYCKTTDFNKIMHNIEHGSERSAIEGSLIECVQNSVDAIRSILSVNPSRSKICITLEHYNPQASISAMSMTVRDYAGFSDFASLMTDFILPDFSHKSSLKGDIGDMGNGSYKLYQQASYVSVLTRVQDASHKVYLLIIKPLRDKDTGHVYDLGLSCIDVTHRVKNDFVGTSIKVTFCEKSSEQVMIDLMATKDYVFQALGATQVTLSNNTPVTIYLSSPQGQQCVNSDPLLCVYEHKDKNTGSVLFKLYKRAHASLQSYITTAGVPLGSLSSVSQRMHLIPSHFMQMLAMGYILDCDIATYKPVQSRTRLQMSDPMIKELRGALLESIYALGVQQASINSVYASWFMHYKSPSAAFFQVRLSEHDNKQLQSAVKDFISGKADKLNDPVIFFTYYRSLSLSNMQQCSFFDFIQHGYKYLVPQLEALEKEVQKVTDDAFEVLVQKHRRSIITEYMAAHTESERDSVKNRWIKHFVSKGQAAAYAQQLSKKASSLFSVWKLNCMERLKGNNQQISHLENWNYGLVSYLVHGWFVNKINKMSPLMPFPEDVYLRLPELNPAQQSSDCSLTIPAVDEEIMHMLKQIFTYMIDSFCKHFCEIIGISSYAGTVVCYDKKPVAGWFDYSTKRINVNVRLFDITQHCELLFKIYCYGSSCSDVKAITTDQAFIDFYAPRPGAAVFLLHELEHARRDDGSGLNGEHAPHSPGKSAQDTYVDFDACANSYGIAAFQQGLLIKWLTDVVHYMYNDQLLISSIEYLMQNPDKLHAYGQLF